jgi:hypothetical protein
MKITIPEHSKDITLLQYQKYIELLSRDIDEHSRDSRKIHCFTTIKLQEVELLSKSDRDDILNKIDIALETPFEFQNTFNIDGIDFGFIPNLDKITTAEYVDLQKYGEKVETLHRLMAILFRPIVSKSLDCYSIAEYKGTDEMADIMKLTPMNCVNGALFFFANLRNELLNYILKYTQEEQAKERPHQTTLKSGDGMQPLTS